MSTIQVRNVESPDGGISDNLLPVTASAWVTFNGTGVVAIIDSHNISSVTDNGTGNYSPNFSTPLLNSNYAATTTSNQTESRVSSVRSTSSCSIFTSQSAGTPTDADFVSLIVLGGQ